MTLPSDDPLMRALTAVVAPLVAVDGGRIEFLARRDGVVEIALEGACQGCPGRNYTTRDVVLPALQAVDPTVTEVRVVFRVPAAAPVSSPSGEQGSDGAV
jgi:Fe-S cluster biogenesis protein NfuA